MRQDARDRVIEKFRNYADSSQVNKPTPIPQLPVLDDNIAIEDELITINDNLFTNLDSSLPTVGLMGSFNKAFRQARNRGLDKFYYSGPDKKAGWFTTELAPASESIQTVGEVFNGKTTGSSVAPTASTDTFYNAGANVREWFKENKPIRSAIRAA